MKSTLQKHTHILLSLTKSQKPVDYHLINDIKLIPNSISLFHSKRELYYHFLTLPTLKRVGGEKEDVFSPISSLLWHNFTGYEIALTLK